jgi:uncharacterized protein YjlB
MSQTKPELHRFPEASDLPLLLYRGALAPKGGPQGGQAEGGAGAKTYEELFARNGWPGAWRNGIYPYHHFHATAHEVLGIAAGHAAVRFGGDGGPVVEVRAGDVVVIPAGVAHCNLGSSPDLLVVGAYPGGRSPDLNKGTPADHPAARAKLEKVALPEADPVFGPDGPLIRHWAGKGD